MNEKPEPVDERLSGDLTAFFTELISQGGAIERNPRNGPPLVYSRRLNEAAADRLASPEWQSLASRIAGEGRLREAERGALRGALKEARSDLVFCIAELGNVATAEERQPLLGTIATIDAALAANSTPPEATK